MFLLYFYQMNAALVSMRLLPKKCIFETFQALKSNPFVVLYKKKKRDRFYLINNSPNMVIHAGEFY